MHYKISTQQGKDRNFVDDEQRAGVDANYYAKDMTIILAENHR